MLTPGDPVPAFHVRSLSNPRYAFGSAAGRYIAVTFLASSAAPGAASFFRQMQDDIGPFDDEFACAFIVTNDPRDQQSSLFQERYPGLRIFLDLDRKMAELFGCAGKGADGSPSISLTTWILDPGMRVIQTIPITDMATHHAQIRAVMETLTPASEVTDGWAPVLAVPHIFEPALCRDLMAYADSQGLEESGYMNTDPVTGGTVLKVDHRHKRRTDCGIEDQALRDAVQARIHRRLVPQVQRAFQFTATRIERHIICCYDAGTGGYFRPHTDNSTLGTAHRRFAVSIGLNAEEYEGGDLRFPEFGPRTYRPTTGGAIVFSCSLLHEALPVTKGRRFAVLPFLYDEAAAKLRLYNARHLSDPQLRDSVLQSIGAPREH
ncbi:2OG-Fe(II) oxygenase family protein [Sphingobium sp. YR768]|uniref:2OG-Fe(II) oxygenase family protein n=1 Tax=Sphingobium sp. YR768 TaxID=1884365 RepID=UPI0008C50F52|nr:2OG-Fe(II) oxygenase [Sphingobium sp. YR768]SES02146.1 Predicted 2-oxoglutarate-and Fe(II)-dependent dioxygenase YbiX [Sphingobium sp. YR768]